MVPTNQTFEDLTISVGYLYKLRNEFSFSVRKTFEERDRENRLKQWVHAQEALEMPMYSRAVYQQTAKIWGVSCPSFVDPKKARCTHDANL